MRTAFSAECADSTSHVCRNLLGRPSTGWGVVHIVAPSRQTWRCFHGHSYIPHGKPHKFLWMCQDVPSSLNQPGVLVIIRSDPTGHLRVQSPATANRVRFASGGWLVPRSCRADRSAQRRQATDETFGHKVLVVLPMRWRRLLKS